MTASLDGGCCLQTEQFAGDNEYDTNTDDQMRVELRDKAAPLPAGRGRASDKCVERSPAWDGDGSLVRTRCPAKDKRKLREKRRSTGIPSPVNDAENDSVDETRRNTWYNETLATSDEFVGCWAPSDLHTAVSTAAPASGTTVVVSPSQRSTSTTTTTDPAGTPTSAVRARLMGTGCSPEPPREPPSSEPTSTATDTEERGTLLARVHALEKMLEEANAEKSQLRETLERRENRIVELQAEVDALNKDMDKTDEDYEKLDQENRALLRVLSQLSPC